MYKQKKGTSMHIVPWGNLRPHLALYVNSFLQMRFEYLQYRAAESLDWDLTTAEIPFSNSRMQSMYSIGI